MSNFTKTGLIILFILILIPFGIVIDNYNNQCHTINYLKKDMSFLQKDIKKLKEFESKYLSLQKEYNEFIYEVAEWQRLALDRNIK